MVNKVIKIQHADGSSFKIRIKSIIKQKIAFTAFDSSKLFMLFLVIMVMLSTLHENQLPTPVHNSGHPPITVTQIYWLMSQSRLLTDSLQICLFHCWAFKPVVFVSPSHAYWHNVCTSVCLLTNTLQDLFLSLQMQPLLSCCSSWDTCWQRTDPCWQPKAPLLSWELNTPPTNLTFYTQ